MRRTRRLILLLIVVILAAVGYTYYVQKATQARSTPAKPRSLPDNVSSLATDWVHAPTRNGLPTYEIKATNYRMSADGNHVELEGVTLKLFTKDAKNFD